MNIYRARCASRRSSRRSSPAPTSRKLCNKNEKHNQINDTDNNKKKKNMFKRHDKSK